MNYTTIPVTLTEGQEAQGVQDAIRQAAQELADESGGYVELVNVVPIPLPDGKLCVTVLAKPCEPPVPILQSRAGILSELKALNWGPETTRGIMP